jgi:hypothetical protein
MAACKNFPLVFFDRGSHLSRQSDTSGTFAARGEIAPSPLAQVPKRRERNFRPIGNPERPTDIGECMTAFSIIPSPIFETLHESDQTLRTTLTELSEDKRKQTPNISDRKLAEYLAYQMGYRGRGNVQALLDSRARVAKSRAAVGLRK